MVKQETMGQMIVNRKAGRPQQAEPTPRQLLMLKFIDEYIREHDGLPPTVREIQKGVGASSTSVVEYHLGILERKGHLLRPKERSSRSLSLPNGPGRVSRAARVPLVGTVPGSSPLAIVNGEVELVEVPPHLTGILPQDNLFALRVKGTGLQDFLFAEGDILLFIRGLLAKADEVVVVWSEAQQELTLKKWENSHKGVTVLGRLLGAIRTTA